MISKFKNVLIWAAVNTVFFVFNLSVYAYVLQGPHAIELMIEKLGKAKSLHVSQKVIFYGIGPRVDTKPPATVDFLDRPHNKMEESQTEQEMERDEKAAAQETRELEESLRFVFSRAFRSEVRSNDSERIHIFTNNKALTIIDGYFVPAAANPFDLYKDPLLYRSRETLAERLLKLGVDVFISSLGRFEEKIAIIIGANYPDESVAQLWIDQETFLPIRWIIKGANGAAGAGTLEARYLLWWKAGKTRYPSRIEFYQDGNLVRVNEVKNFEENPTFSPNLFNIEHLKTVYPQASERPIAFDETEEPSEVQKTIEEFKRVYD